MSKKPRTYDVFISHSSADVETARRIADHLRKAGFAAFFFGSKEFTENTASMHDALWEALAESEALIVIMSSDTPNTAIGVEIGAASAWHKPIYIVLNGPMSAGVSRMVRDYPVYPLGRIDDIVRSIRAGLVPLTPDELNVLVGLYREIDVPTDQLSRQPAALGKLTRLFNKKVSRSHSGERLLREMIRLRKSGNWPRLLRTASLTERQRQVLHLIAEGQSTREIAAILQVSERAVEVHRRHLREKLGARNMAQLCKDTSD